MQVDHLFVLAVAAIGWGLSLATYRPIAQLNGWPLGSAQLALPAVTTSFGIVSAGVGLAFAAALGAQHGGLVILMFGVGVAIFWSGFLRVGAQSALLLAPLSALALLFAWALRTPVLPLP
jgi:hypothetical protein